jgi:hypothetical protein
MNPGLPSKLDLWERPSELWSPALYSKFAAKSNSLRFGIKRERTTANKNGSVAGLVIAKRLTRDSSAYDDPCHR